MKKPPCHKCQVRHFKCHAKCKEYFDWKAERDQVSAIMKQENEKYTLLSAVNYNHTATSKFRRKPNG